MNQPTFADLDYESKKRKTGEKFLERMDGLIPWEELEERIRPFYPKAGRGRRPYPTDTLRAVVLQPERPWDGGHAYEVESVRRFAETGAVHGQIFTWVGEEGQAPSSGGDTLLGMGYATPHQLNGMGITRRLRTANVDLTELPRLLHGGESQVWGDAGYQGVDRPGNRGLDVEWHAWSNVHSRGACRTPTDQSPTSQRPKSEERPCQGRL